MDPDFRLPVILMISFSVVAWYKLGLRQSLDSLFRKQGNRFLDHGGLTMRKHYLLFLSLLFPAFLILSGYTVVKAQQEVLRRPKREALV